MTSIMTCVRNINLDKNEAQMTGQIMTMMVLMKMMFANRIL